MTSQPRRAVVLVGLVGFLFASLVAIRVLADSEWDATRFVAFGEEAHPTTEYAERRLGDIYLRSGQGHDGKFFFVQANDPWLIEPASNAAVLDRPLYRSQRMLYPVLVGLGGAASPTLIVWLMLLLNLVAVGAGTRIVGSIAVLLGGSPWLGLAFALNPGFVSELTINGAGVVAGVFLFAGVLTAMKERFAMSAVFLMGSALSREVFLLAAAGTAVWLWRKGERLWALVIGLVPTAAVVLWGLYLRLRLDPISGLSEIREFGWPGVGLAHAFSQWLGDPVSLVFGALLLLVVGFFFVRAIQRRELIGFATAGFAAISLFLSEPVWTNYFDIGRAVAPVITAYVLLAFASRPFARLASEEPEPP